MDEMGRFYAPTADRPGVARWTKQSHVVKLGMIWTFPVTVGSRNASLQLSVERGILWMYVDLYNYADFHPNVFNKDFDLVRSEWMEETLRLRNQVSTSKVEEALSNMAPVQLAVETPFVGTPVRSPDALETSNVKLAWLNVSDNTSVVCAIQYNRGGAVVTVLSATAAASVWAPQHVLLLRLRAKPSGPVGLAAHKPVHTRGPMVGSAA
jgi:hypothetical protein